MRYVLPPLRHKDMINKLIDYLISPVVFLLACTLGILSLFRKKRPELIEDPEWVMRATERELTIARMTGKYPPHPPERVPMHYPTDVQIRKLASKIIEEAKKAERKPK